jgi:oxalate decarboxylase/phosphoglucose isomerase-like protein (cupin superfamily)
MDTTTIRVGTDELTFRVASEALLAVDVRIPAGGGPPLLHRHEPAEVYRTERGELAIYLEEDGAVRRIATAAGDVVHIPGGVAHTVRNESDAGAAAYVVFSPGAPMERFMRAAGALEDPAVEDVLALAARHGVAFSGPVPAR